MSMKKGLIPLLVFLAGVGLIAFSVVKGDSGFALFLIFPVVYGGGLYMGLGVLFIFLSFLLLFILPMSEVDRGRKGEGVYRTKEKRTESKYGGVIFIGPIPIIFGKDKSMAKKMLYVGLAIAIILAVVYVLIIFNV